MHSIHKNKSVQRSAFFAVVMALTFAIAGCLEEGSSKTSDSSGVMVDLGFAGIDTVQDMDGTTIKISWSAASSAQVVGYRIYEISATGTYTAIQQVDSTITTYRHTGLTLGSTHTYMVKAIDGSGDVDTNTVVKSAFTFGGASSVTATDLTTMTVHFTPTSAVAGINIYYKAARASTWTLAGTTTNSASSYSVTGLNSGTTYQFKVMAYNDSNIEDTNLQTVSGQTYSSSYNPPAPYTAKYAGFILAQAFGAAPGAPTPPTSREINLVWAAFSGSGSAPAYALVRTTSGSTLDMTTTTACTSLTTSSCRVCTVTGSGPQSCVDSNIAASPAVYDYAVSLLSATNWPEELPTSISDRKFRITVPVPPTNMVLVQRDSVNYEVCKIMGKTPDPLNKQRCAITGNSMIGSIPYNTNPGGSPLNLSNTYYDFGYDLFVDRWESACNWTPVAGTYSGQTNNGMCGASKTSGNCYGTATPDSTIGVEGNVYYNTSTSICYYRTASAWISAASASSLTSAQRSVMSTIDPSAQGGYRPPLAFITQTSSSLVCSSNVDSYYGAKRLLRRREFIAAAAFAKFPGEPNYLDDTTISTLEAGSTTGAHSSLYQCNSNSHYGITAGGFRTTHLAGDSTDAVKSFNIGSLETSNCVSRFGAQDMVGNNWEWNSDQIYCNYNSTAITTPYYLAAYTCLGVISSIDNGNGYSASFDVNGFMFDGTTGPGGSSTVTEWNLPDGSFSASYFNVPMGLPLLTTDNGNALSISSNSSLLHGDRYFIYTNNNTNLRAVHSGGSSAYQTGSGRWAARWAYGTDYSLNSIGFRCALPAE